jgi:T5orf172 domain
MESVLTDTEKGFLTSQGLGADDVMDIRGIPQRLWFHQIEEEGKTVALGSRCKAAGHRLRSRRGHCVQCDTSKLGYQAPHAEERYVYIAGSRSARLIKIGNCRDTAQRERQVRSERYGGVGDWDFVYSVRVKRAGAVEDAARARLSRYRATGEYWKNNELQTGTELLRCSYSQAEAALIEASKGSALGTPWKAHSRVGMYEFEIDDT